MGVINLFKRICFLSSLLFLFIIYIPSICAADYYADIEITVDSEGYVTIDGDTNYPDLLVSNTQNYTYKKQSVWMLNITKQDVFSDIVYKVTLPPGSSISHIDSSGYGTINENNGYLIINGVAENESLSIIVQYRIEKSSENTIRLLVNIILFTGIIITAITLIYLLIKDRKKTEESINKNDTVPGYDFKGLNDRQKQIMKLLIDRQAPLTQTDIQRELNIPKAAVSRNVQGLERKGLIEKEQIGMSNKIRLKKP